MARVKGVGVLDQGRLDGGGLKVNLGGQNLGFTLGVEGVGHGWGS